MLRSPEKQNAAGGRRLAKAQTIGGLQEKHITSTWCDEDAQRENRIKRMAASVLAAPTAQEGRIWFEFMRAEIALRSPTQVRRMEQARGLRKPKEASPCVPAN